MMKKMNETERELVNTVMNDAKKAKRKLGELRLIGDLLLQMLADKEITVEEFTQKGMQIAIERKAYKRIVRNAEWVQSAWPKYASEERAENEVDENVAINRTVDKIWATKSYSEIAEQYKKEFLEDDDIEALMAG